MNVSLYRHVSRCGRNCRTGVGIAFRDRNFERRDDLRSDGKLSAARAAFIVTRNCGYCKGCIAGIDVSGWRKRVIARRQRCSVSLYRHVIRRRRDSRSGVGITFRTFDSSILNALSTGGLVFKGNTIEPSGTYPPINPDMPVIKLEGCPNAVIEGNTYKGSGAGSISMDEFSKKSAKVSGQKGF